MIAKETILEKLDRKIECANKNDIIELVTFKKSDFKKKNPSTKRGVGFQDLRKQPQELVRILTCKGFNIIFEPVSMDMNNIQIKLNVKK